MKLNTKQLRKQKNTITISTKESLKDIEPYFIERKEVITKMLKILYKLLALLLLLVSYCISLVNFVILAVGIITDKIDSFITKQLCKVEELFNKISKK